MTKFKTWLYERFLPAYCRDDLLAANKRLCDELRDQRAENERLQCYIRGLETGIRSQRRVNIRNEVGK